MRIALRNEFGSFEMGGGSHPSARLIEITGLGVPGKENTTIVFEGQPGQTLTESRDMERTITMSFDFYGDERTVQKLYRIIYRPVTIYFYLNNGERRKIVGHCTQSTDITKIIYHKWQSVVLQFICYDPYFHNVTNTVLKIAKPVNKLPNVNENGEWYVQLPAVATEIDKTVIANNTGQTILYPIIKIYSNKSEDDNPEAYGIVISNKTTGGVITIEYNLSVNEALRVDIPQRKIISNINGDITNYMSDDTVLSSFFLDIGENIITVDNPNPNDKMYAEIEFTNNYMAVVI